MDYRGYYLPQSNKSASMFINKPCDIKMDSSEVYEDVVVNEKVGDELLIDLVRSRPYLYNKASKEYKDSTMKETAWQEIATATNIPVSECQSRWLRLRQHFSKERQLREQETRSGAGKTTRKKWPIYDSLTFLSQHIAKRNSFSNVCATSIEDNDSRQLPLHVDGTERQKPQFSPQFQHCRKSLDSSNEDTGTNEEADENYDALLTTSFAETQERKNLVLGSRSNIMPADEFEFRKTPSTSSSASFGFGSSSRTSTPQSCFVNDGRKVKKQKVDPVESAFHRMNDTITTMVDKICTKWTKENVPEEHDPDVIIGKLVTAELKKAAEPKKERMKKQFMNILYSFDDD